MNTLFNVVPTCLRNAEQVTNLKDCLIGNPGAVLPYWTNMLFLLVGITSFVYLIIAGYKMMTGFGDEAKYAEAKKTMLAAIIGLVIAIFAAVIIQAVVSFLQGNSISS